MMTVMLIAMDMAMVMIDYDDCPFQYLCSILFLLPLEPTIRCLQQS